MNLRGLALALLVGCGAPVAKEPPAPVAGASTGETGACAAAGGRCEAVGACGVGAGLLTSPSCGAAHLVCCLPLSACPAEDFECSNGSYCARPSCEAGSLACAEGFTRVAAGACASPQR